METYDNVVCMSDLSAMRQELGRWRTLIVNREQLPGPALGRPDQQAAESFLLKDINNQS